MERTLAGRFARAYSFPTHSAERRGMNGHGAFFSAFPKKEVGGAGAEHFSRPFRASGSCGEAPDGEDGDVVFLAEFLGGVGNESGCGASAQHLLMRSKRRACRSRL